RKSWNVLSLISAVRCFNASEISSQLGCDLSPATNRFVFCPTTIQLQPGIFWISFCIIVLLKDLASSQSPDAAYKFESSTYEEEFLGSNSISFLAALCPLFSSPCILQAPNKLAQIIAFGSTSILSMNSSASFRKPHLPSRSTMQA
ncbi:hypothetical protein VIGAN_05186600, partial [Vigna angularis var. angularis]